MNALQKALRTFRTTGDVQDCLKALGVDRGPRLQHALQRALTLAHSREERDTLEDISFICSSPSSIMMPTQVLFDEIIEKVEAAYGNFVPRFINIVPFASGLYRSTNPPPPVECIVATIGIVAERNVGWTIPVGPQELGQVLEFFTRNCPQCHGEGYIFCQSCLKQAYERIAQLPIHLRNQLSEETDSLARQVLTANAQAFGCMLCHHEPAQACECRSRIPIPQRFRDGEIVRGTYIRSGQEVFCCLRLKDASV